MFKLEITTSLVAPTAPAGTRAPEWPAELQAIADRDRAARRAVTGTLPGDRV